MSRSDSAVINTPNTSMVVALPELVQLIGHCLDPSDLRSCIQVCRTWNQVLIPVLWHTVDTNSPSWARICNVYEARREPVATGKVAEENDTYSGEEWVHATLVYYGQYIRHLTVRWDVVLEAASFNPKCRNLLTLAAGQVGNGSTYTSLPFPLRLTSSTTTPTTTPKEEKEKRIVECFWSLVRQNPSLTSLVLPNLSYMSKLSKEYIAEALSQLKKLTDLDLEWLPLDAKILLDALPQLKRLRGCSIENLLSLQRNYNNLQYLYHCSDVKISIVLLMLKHLPGLEKLRLWRILEEPPVGTLSTVVARTAPFLRLRIFEIEWTLPHEDPYIALFVQLLPNLRRFSNLMVHIQTKKALWDHCYYLETLNGRADVVVELWRQRRAKDGNR